MSDLKIERGIPLPSRRQSQLSLILAQMEIGDSVFVPKMALSSVGSYAQKHRPKIFTSRSCDGGVRIWRTA